MRIILCFLKAIMNLVLLLSIILAVQLPLLTFGKSSLAKVESSTSQIPITTASPKDGLLKSDETTAIRMRRNSIDNSKYDDEDDDDDDFSINKPSRDFSITKLAATCINEWNYDVENVDIAIAEKMRKLFDISCHQNCRTKIFIEIFSMLKCFDIFNGGVDMERIRRGNNLDFNDMFMPVRGRRSKPPAEIIAEKKARLQVLKNDLFVPNRGRRTSDNRKTLLPMMLFKKRNGIDLSSKDYFMPNRGKREPSIDAILSDNFFPQRGKKKFTSSAAATPHTPVVINMPLPLDSWPIPNIIPDDKIMIDLLRDLNQLVSDSGEANKDITAAVQDETTATTMSGVKNFIPIPLESFVVPTKTTMIFKPSPPMFNDESSQIFKPTATNSIFTNTPPFVLDDHSNTFDRFNSHHHHKNN